MGAQQEDIDRQRKLADMMRKDAAGGLKGQMVGRHFRAPNGAEVVANVVQNYVANDQEQSASAASKQLSQQQQGASKRWMDLLLGRKNLEGTPAVPADWGG
jgi:hypothetical protein